jgi:hypothetical protein
MSSPTGIKRPSFEPCEKDAPFTKIEQEIKNATERWRLLLFCIQEVHRRSAGEKKKKKK